METGPSPLSPLLSTSSSSFSPFSVILEPRAITLHLPCIPQQTTALGCDCETHALGTQSRAHRAASFQPCRRAPLLLCVPHRSAPQSCWHCELWPLWQWKPGSLVRCWFWNLASLILLCTQGSALEFGLPPSRGPGRDGKSCAHSLWWQGLGSSSYRQSKWDHSGRLVRCLNPCFWKLK